MKKDDIVITSFLFIVGIALVIGAIAVRSVIIKILLWIIAILVISIAIYAVVDAVKRKRNQPKNIVDFFKDVIQDAASKPDFEERMDAAAHRRDVLFDGQRVKDPDYGYSKLNPIMVSNIFRINEYLGKLRTLNGKAFTWNRIGSYCVNELHSVEGVMVDEYQLFLDGEEYKTIYICPYGHTSFDAPAGMKLL